MLTRSNRAHGHEKHGKEASSNDGRRSCNRVSNSRYKHEANNMQRSIIRLGRAQRYADREEESRKLQGQSVNSTLTPIIVSQTYPSRCSEPQSGDLSITKRSNNSREEVLECLGNQADVLKKNEEVESIIAYSQLDTVPDCLFAVGVDFANILCQAPCCECSLFLGQPFGGVRVIGQSDCGDERESDSSYAFLFSC